MVLRGREAGVSAVLMPDIDSSSRGAMLEVAGRYPGECLPMVGLHPTSVNDNPGWRGELERVAALLEAANGRKEGAAERPAGGGTKLYGVGETGLDLYWSRDFEAEQREAFAFQAELALKYDLPLVIHTRDAWAQVREVLAGFAGRGLRGVMHAFSGSWEDFEALEQGFMVGIGGTVTYKNSGVAGFLNRIPLERVVLETDAPYLTPVPWRGKRNEPAYLTVIAAKVGGIYGVDPGRVEEVTDANARKMFGL